MKTKRNRHGVSGVMEVNKATNKTKSTRAHLNWTRLLLLFATAAAAAGVTDNTTRPQTDADWVGWAMWTAAWGPLWLLLSLLAFAFASAPWAQLEVFAPPSPPTAVPPPPPAILLPPLVRRWSSETVPTPLHPPKSSDGPFFFSASLYAPNTTSRRSIPQFQIERQPKIQNSKKENFN